VRETIFFLVYGSRHFFWVGALQLESAFCSPTWASLLDRRESTAILLKKQLHSKIEVFLSFLFVWCVDFNDIDRHMTTEEMRFCRHWNFQKWFDRIDFYIRNTDLKTFVWSILFVWCVDFNGIDRHMTTEEMRFCRYENFQKWFDQNDLCQKYWFENVRYVSVWEFYGTLNVSDWWHEQQSQKEDNKVLWK